jgi:hypothetical protein
MERGRRQGELFVAIVTLAFAGVMLWDSRRYGPSPFEPIGSGAIPAGVAAIAILLALILLASIIRIPRARFEAANAVAEEDGAGMGPRVVATFLLTVGYAALLASGLVRYAYATVPFMIVGVLIVAERPRRLLAPAVALALIAAFSLDLAFRHIFTTNLP